MPNLSEVLGAIMAGLTEARRVADEEALRVAERYQQEPLLRGLAVPRIRLPEVTIDIPVIIDSQEGGEDEEPASPEDVASKSSQYLLDIIAKEKIILPKSQVDDFSATLTASLKEIIAKPVPGTRLGTRKAFASAGEAALLQLSRQPKSPLAKVPLARIIAQLREFIASIAVVKEGKPPGINLIILTDQVKTKTDPQTVTRLHINLREEGLEWSEYTSDSGETVTKLTPE